MKVSESIQKAYLEATGKTNLATTDTKYAQLLALADLFQKEWQDESDVQWDSLYLQPVNIGTISQSTSNAGLVSTMTAIDMDSSIREISFRDEDSVILLGTDGLSTWNYDIIKPAQFNQFVGRQACCIIQGQLIFCTPFLATDARLGASIFVPGFGFVDDITKDTQTVQVDDPLWLAYRMAGEFVRNDLVRRSQYPNILALANERMKNMISNNEGQRDEIPIDMDDLDFAPDSQASAWN